MNSLRLGINGFARRFGAQARSNGCRSVKRRNYSAEVEKDYGFVGRENNAFNRERAAIKEHAGQTAELWRKMTWYIMPACISLSGANAYRLWVEHWEAWEKGPKPWEKPQYEYLNIRRKKFPWGDGNKTLFWNDKVNWMPEYKKL